MLPVFITVPLNDEERDKADYLYAKYRQVLFSCAVKFVKDANAAEDIVQSTFVAIFQHLEAIVDCDSKATSNYLITAARHFAYRYHNAQKRDLENIVYLDDELQELPGDNDVWDIVKSRVTMEELSMALRKLNDKYRFLLVGKYYNGFTYRELGEMMGISENAVSSRIVLAKSKLTKLLDIKEVQ